MIDSRFQEDPRKAIVVRLRKEGKSFQEIGVILNVSRQRVQQILIKRPPQRMLTFCLVCHKKLELGDGRKHCIECLSTGAGTLKKINGRDFLREQVRLRDRHTCQSCGLVWNKVSRKFDVHHKNPELEGNIGRKYSNNYNLDDMITLCHKCHMNLHQVKDKMTKKNREIGAKKKASKLSPTS